MLGQSFLPLWKIYYDKQCGHRSYRYNLPKPNRLSGKLIFKMFLGGFLGFNFHLKKLLRPVACFDIVILN